jgi:MBG domain-containing protein
MTVGRRTLSTLLAFVTAAALTTVGLASVSASADVATCTSTGSPRVTTDKPDYIIGETVHITGTGYGCGSTVTVRIVPPNPAATWTQQEAIGSDGALAATYQIPTVDNLGRYHLSVLDASGTVLASTAFSDTHFRYGSISWSRPSLASRTVTFTIQAAFRYGYFTQPACFNHGFNVGDTIPSGGVCTLGNLAFGDSQSAPFPLTITSIDTTNDILQGFSTLTHTYPGTGTKFTANWLNCCRLSSLSNNHDTNWNVQTVVNLDPTSGALQSPTSLLPAMTDCAVGAVCTIPIPGSDADPNAAAITYRLSTPTELGDPTETQPPGAAVDPNTGVFTWNSAGHGGPGTLWNSSVMLEASNSAGAVIATVQVDFLIRLVNDAPPTFVSPPSPTDGAVLAATVGNQLNVPLEAVSPTGHPVSVHALSTLTGATLTCPAPATPIDCTYTWTPTLNDTGAHLVAFQAEDSLGATSATLNITINVAQVEVTVTPDNQTITYGVADPAFTFQYTGFLGSDDFTTQPTCGVTGAHTAAGTYPITCSGGVAPAGYHVVYHTGTLTVGQQTVTVTPNPQTITYGDADPAFTFGTSGFVSGDGFTTAPTCGVVGPHSAAGTYPITCAGGDAGTNYTIDYGTATLTVKPKPLTVTADDKPITYGDPEPTFTFSTSGFVTGDGFATAPTCVVTGSHSDVGTYPIVCSGGNAGPNYTIGYVDGTLTISAETIVVEPDPQTITYGQPDPAFTFTHTPFAAGDSFSTPPTCQVAGPHANAATYTITCSGAAVSGNYTLSYDTNTLTVNPKPVTITADNKSSVYGQPDPAFTSSTAGLIAGDALTTAPTCGVAVPHANAGSYPITCSGADAGSNYSIQYVGGTLTVGTATVTITPNNQSKLPNAADPAFTFTVSGLVPGDNLTTGPTCGVSGPHDAPGTYTITCSGADAGSNYTIAYGTATLTVAKATPALSTSPSPSVPVGGQISDTAQLTGGASPSGTVTFTLYGPGDTTCAHPLATRVGTLTGGSAGSGTVQATQAGTYYWVASYGGDAANNVVTGSCGDERVIVTPQVLTGRAYGLTATASLGTKTLLNVKPTPDTGAVSTTSTSNHTPPCVLKITLLVNVKAVCASVVTSSAFPAKSTATASVAAVTVSVAGLPAIVVQAVQSTSATTCGGSAGTVTIAYLRVGTVTVINKPTAIKPNTTLNVGIVKLVLNEQHTFITPDHGLTVNAVHATANVLGSPVLNVVIASSESDIGNCP